MGKTVNFMFCVFYHYFLKKQNDEFFRCTKLEEFSSSSIPAQALKVSPWERSKMTLHGNQGLPKGMKSRRNVNICVYQL